MTNIIHVMNCLFYFFIYLQAFIMVLITLCSVMTVHIFLYLIDITCAFIYIHWHCISQKGNRVGDFNPAVKQSPPEEVWGKGAVGSRRLFELICELPHTQSCFLERLPFIPASVSCSLLPSPQPLLVFRKQTVGSAKMDHY